MAAYVDKLRDWGWRYGKSCHLAADTLEELHAFAASIGMKRSWFQGGRRPHYDLTERRRAAAVALGAREVDDREFIAVVNKLGEGDADSLLR